MIVEALVADLKYAVRTVVAGRLFCLVAVTCLALGIAASTTVFSVFDALLLRPLPFKDADALVSVSGRQPETRRRVALTLDDVRALRQSVQTLDAMAAYAGRTATLNDGGEPERVPTQLVTANLFRLLGQSPQLGRAFTEVDDRLSAPCVALISDSLWRRRYQADPSIAGRVVRLDGVPYTIVGVMPPQFRFPSKTDLWTPAAAALGAAESASRSVSVLGHLAPGVTVDRANAELAVRLLQPQGSRGVRAGYTRPFRSVVVGDEERTIVGTLMGATVVLLAVACVNLANLMLARGALRRREIAVRAALGANRTRIARQLLAESVLIGLIAAAVGVPLAWYGIHWVHGAVPPTEPLGPSYLDWSLDVRALLFAIGAAVVTGIAFGLAPALDATGPRLLVPLREKAGTGGSRVQRRTHSALIFAQTALAVALLATSSLFVRTYAGLRAVELGYDPAHLMTARFYLAGPAYDQAEARARAVSEMAARLDNLPGAAAATVTDLVPLDDQGGSDAPAAVEGRAFEEGREPTVHYAGVAGRWPETFDLRPLAGRSFYDHELRGKAPVALVNARMAQDFWPGQSPLGRRFRFAEDPASPWFTVIGVVANIRTVKLDERRGTPPTAYIPHPFLATRNYGIVVRTRAQPESVTAAVREAVHAVDPSVALFDIFPMEQVRWLSYWMYIMWGTMFGALGAISVFVAAVGVYGVVFYTVGERTREIGVRVAVGARRSQIVGPLLRHVGLLATAGIVVGLVGARAVTPVVGALLIGVSPNDPAGNAGVALLLAGTALVATWIPAWRASAVDPVVALREE